MKYSTTIALFLGHVSAAATTWDDIANGNCSVDTVADNNSEASLATCSSLEACAADADCADSDEKCGYFLWTENDGMNNVEEGKCVYKYACGDVGIRGLAQTWQLLCYDDTEPETLPDTQVIFDTVEDIVNEAETKEWITDFENMKIPSRDNYQTGRWVLGDDGLWDETDKPKNNLCTANTDCASGKCCANWPDSNNLRCINADLAGVEQDLEPFTAFTPACAVNANVEPTSAKDDLAAEAEAKASEALATQATELQDDAKKADGYDSMTAEEEEAWDEAWAEAALEIEANEEAQRETAGYGDFDNDQKAIWQDELVAFKDEVLEACDSAPNSIGCLKADEIREEMEKLKNEEGYYTEMNAEEREAFLDEMDGELETFEAELTAAWYTANKPAAGEAGSACVSKKCTGTNQCCGTSTAGSDKTENLCVDKTTLAWTDGLGVAYTHVCGAQKLMAAFTATFAAAYLM